MSNNTVRLFFTSGSSDKQYNVSIRERYDGVLFDVWAAWGRRGAVCEEQLKSDSEGCFWDDAVSKANDLINSKTSKGYTTDPSGIPHTANGWNFTDPTYSGPGVSGVAVQSGVMGTPAVQAPASVETLEPGYMPQLLNPIDDSEAAACLNDVTWVMQEKMDGKHIVLVWDGVSSLKAYNKKGKLCAFPLAHEMLAQFHNMLSFTIDGELIGDKYYIFDLLKWGDKDFRGEKYGVRHHVLASTIAWPSCMWVVPLYYNGIKAEKYASFVAAKAEGVVFKRADRPHHPGRPNSGGDMLKYKFQATCSCRVAKINQKDSIAVEILNGDKWVGIGNVTTIGHEKPPVGSVVEVRYLYYYPGGSLYQPCFLGVRDDVDAEECVISQLKCKAGTVAPVVDAPAPVVKKTRKIEWQ